jgi:hypothetical protein
MQHNVILFFLLHTVSVNPFSLKRSKKENQCTYHYSPGTHKIYNSVSPRNLRMIKDKALEFPEVPGGGKGEPGVPPKWTKYILESARTENWNSAKYYRTIYISGKDQRFPEGDLDKSQLEEIKSNMEKLNRLNYLASDRISSMDKIETIKDVERETNGTITGYNPFSGGLMNDWDWDFV